MAGLECLQRAVFASRTVLLLCFFLAMLRCKRGYALRCVDVSGATIGLVSLSCLPVCWVVMMLHGNCVCAMLLFVWFRMFGMLHWLVCNPQFGCVLLWLGCVDSFLTGCISAEEGVVCRVLILLGRPAVGFYPLTVSPVCLPCLPACLVACPPSTCCGCLPACLLGWLASWPVGRCVGWSVGCSVARLLGCSVARLLGCSVARLLGCSVARLLGCSGSAGRLVGLSVGRLVGRLVGRRAGWSEGRFVG